MDRLGSAFGKDRQLDPCDLGGIEDIATAVPNGKTQKVGSLALNRNKPSDLGVITAAVVSGPKQNVRFFCAGNQSAGTLFFNLQSPTAIVQLNGTGRQAEKEPMVGLCVTDGFRIAGAEIIGVADGVFTRAGRLL